MKDYFKHNKSSKRQFKYHSLNQRMHLSKEKSTSSLKQSKLLQDQRNEYQFKSNSKLRNKSHKSTSLSVKKQKNTTPKCIFHPKIKGINYTQIPEINDKEIPLCRECTEKVQSQGLSIKRIKKEKKSKYQQVIQQVKKTQKRLRESFVEQKGRVEGFFEIIKDYFETKKVLLLQTLTIEFKELDESVSSFFELIQQKSQKISNSQLSHNIFKISHFELDFNFPSIPPTHLINHLHPLYSNLWKSLTHKDSLDYPQQTHLNNYSNNHHLSLVSYKPSLSEDQKGKGHKGVGSMEKIKLRPQLFKLYKVIMSNNVFKSDRPLPNTQVLNFREQIEHEMKREKKVVKADQGLKSESQYREIARSYDNFKVDCVVNQSINIDVLITNMLYDLNKLEKGDKKYFISLREKFDKFRGIQNQIKEDKLKLQTLVRIQKKRLADLTYSSHSQLLEQYEKLYQNLENSQGIKSQVMTPLELKERFVKEKRIVQSGNQDNQSKSVSVKQFSISFQDVEETKESVQSPVDQEQKINDLSVKVKELKRKYNKLIISKNNQKHKYETQILQLKEQVGEGVKDQGVFSGQESERQRRQINTLNRLNQEYQITINNLESQKMRNLQESEGLRGQINTLKKINQEYQITINKLKNEGVYSQNLNQDGLRRQINTLNKLNQQNQITINNLQNIKMKNQKESEEQSRQINTLNRLNQEYQITIKKLKNQEGDYRKQSVGLRRQIDTLNKINSQNQQIINNLQREGVQDDRKNDELRAQINNFNQLNQEYQITINNLESQKVKNQKVSEEQREQINTLNKMNQEYQITINKLKNEGVQDDEESEGQRRQINTLNRLNQEYQITITNLQSQIDNLRNSQKNFQNNDGKTQNPQKIIFELKNQIKNMKDQQKKELNGEESFKKSLQDTIFQQKLKINQLETLISKNEIKNSQNDKVDILQKKLQDQENTIKMYQDQLKESNLKKFVGDQKQKNRFTFQKAVNDVMGKQQQQNERIREDDHQQLKEMIRSKSRDLIKMQKIVQQTFNDSDKLKKTILQLEREIQQLDQFSQNVIRGEQSDLLRVKKMLSESLKNCQILKDQVVFLEDEVSQLKKSKNEIIDKLEKALIEQQIENQKMKQESVKVIKDELVIQKNDRVNRNVQSGVNVRDIQMNSDKFYSQQRQSKQLNLFNQHRSTQKNQEKKSVQYVDIPIEEESYESNTEQLTQEVIQRSLGDSNPDFLNIDSQQQQTMNLVYDTPISFGKVNQIKSQSSYPVQDLQNMNVFKNQEISIQKVQLNTNTNDINVNEQLKQLQNEQQKQVQEIQKNVAEKVEKNVQQETQENSLKNQISQQKQYIKQLREELQDLRISNDQSKSYNSQITQDTQKIKSQSQELIKVKKMLEVQLEENNQMKQRVKLLQNQINKGDYKMNKEINQVDVKELYIKEDVKLRNQIESLKQEKQSIFQKIENIMILCENQEIKQKLSQLVQNQVIVKTDSVRKIDKLITQLKNIKNEDSEIMSQSLFSFYLEQLQKLKNHTFNSEEKILQQQRDIAKLNSTLTEKVKENYMLTSILDNRNTTIVFEQKENDRLIRLISQIRNQNIQGHDIIEKVHEEYLRSLQNLQRRQGEYQKLCEKINCLSVSHLK